MNRCINCREAVYRVTRLDGAVLWVRHRDGKLNCQAWRPMK